MFLTAYTALGRAPLDLTTTAGRDHLDLLINTFDEICVEIPTRHLRECYRRSMRLTDARGQPLFWDARAVYAAWTQLHAELQNAPASLSDVCPDEAHHVAGEETALVEYFNPATGEEFLMPCPTCRSAAFLQKAAEKAARQQTEGVRQPHPLRLVESVALRQRADRLEGDWQERLRAAVRLRCSRCGASGELISTAFGYAIGQTCGARQPQEDAPCDGVLEAVAA